jgi:hypothetical protein
VASFNRYESKKTSPAFAYILWGLTLGMLAANGFGAGIPWLVVFAPLLLQLAALVLVLAILGVTAIIVAILE